MARYAEYKDSGEGWISEVPKHWELKKLKHIFFEKKHKGNMVLNCGSISFGKVVKKDDDKVPYATKASYQEVLQGEFLLNPLNLNYDLISLRIALSKLDVVVSAGYIVLKTQIEANKEYYKYLLHRYDVAFMKLLGSGVRQTINFNHIADSILIAPPLSEQTAIAKFLDDKVAKIEALVGIKRRQIELLAERKQVLIQNAVTQGLNPDAPMKESGVDWIGEIPEHWEVKRNAILFQERKDAGNEKLPVLSVSIHSGVSTKELSEDENIRSTIKIQDRTAYKEVLSGYIAYNMMRAWQGGIGAVKVHGMVSPAYVVAKPIKDLDSEYFELLYRTPAFIWQMDSYSKGITDFRKRLYWEGFRELMTIAPPIKEQQEIIEICALESIKIDKTITLKQNQIEKLTEYKTTLINAAVTGKIKVAGE